jgi:hypothetical protein
LLGSGLEVDNETTFAARQQIFNKQVYTAIARQGLANKHIPMEMIGATIEELCFLCGPSRGVISEMRFRA